MIKLERMVEEEEEQEETNDYFLGKLQDMDVDFDSNKAKADQIITEF